MRSLCGIVMLKPSKFLEAIISLISSNCSGGISSASYVSSRPKALKFASCITGDNECAIGWPMTANFIIAPPYIIDLRNTTSTSLGT